MFKHERQIVLPYDEAMALMKACETIRATATLALQDLRCGLAGRAAYRLESLANFIPMEDRTNAAQIENQENVASLALRRVQALAEKVKAD